MLDTNHASRKCAAGLSSERAIANVVLSVIVSVRHDRLTLDGSNDQLMSLTQGHYTNHYLRNSTAIILT